MKHVSLHGVRDLNQILLDYWGYDSFRPLQKEIISSIIEGHDTVALLPTGGGKSMCYQLPSLAMPGWSLVISPLISLIQDQESQLIQRGIPVVALHSGLHSSVIRKRLIECQETAQGVILMAPERILSERTQEYLRLIQISFIAIDEAHCISQWGHDFRPAYLQLKQLRTIWPDKAMLALTGTATQPVLQDISTHLGMKMPNIFRASFARPNIHISTLLTEQKWSWLIAMLKRNVQCSIVYVRSRRKVMELSAHLNGQGVSALPYHAGMSAEQRQTHQSQWLNNEVSCMVATSAFGMGVDKPDVRTVYHLEPPASPEEYYQEIGRAGRDGLDSDAILLHHASDRRQLFSKFQDEMITLEEVLKMIKDLRHWVSDSGSDWTEEVGFDLYAFSSRLDWIPKRCRQVLDWLIRQEYVSIKEGVLDPSKIHIYRNKVELEPEDPGLAPYWDLVKMILRLYEGVLTLPVAVHEPDIAQRLNWPIEKVIQVLSMLDKRGYLSYFPSQEGTVISLLPDSGRDERYLVAIHHKYMEWQKLKRSRLNFMLEWVESEACKQRQLLDYFGESDTENCGHCDWCRTHEDNIQNKQEHQVIENRLKQMFSVKKEHTLQELILEFPLYQKKAILAELKTMMDDDTIRYHHGHFIVNLA